MAINRLNKPGKGANVQIYGHCVLKACSARLSLEEWSDIRGEILLAPMLLLVENWSEPRSSSSYE